jgi:predicted nucleotide-binding protein (sugar kinase/HSP70/actin superfamily)
MLFKEDDHVDNLLNTVTINKIREERINSIINTSKQRDKIQENNKIANEAEEIRKERNKKGKGKTQKEKNKK